MGSYKIHSKNGEQESKIESRLNDGVTIEVAELMANKFNNYFNSIALSHAENIQIPSHFQKLFAVTID